MERVDAEDLDDLPRLFHVLAETLVAVQRAADGPTRAAAFAEAKKKVEDALASLAPKEPNPDLSRTYKRWAIRISKDAGGFVAWAWGTWKKLRPSV